MRLARFFHRARDEDGRKLLLITSSGCADPSRPIVMGLTLGDSPNEFLRRDCPGLWDAVTTFNGAAERLQGQGYVEIAETDYTVSRLPAEPATKPQWQRGLDKLFLAMILEDGRAQARHSAALAETPAAREPLYRWAAARRAVDTDALAPATRLAMTQEAERLLAERRTDGLPYTWSLAPLELAAFIDDLLCECHLALDDPHAALAAAQRARDTWFDPYRGGRIAWILCEYFPEHQEEAFEQAYRHGDDGGYEPVRRLPGYAQHVRRMKKIQRSARPWRWSARTRPAREAEISEAERRLGTALPADYRRFLADKGPAELLINVADASIALEFYEPNRLAVEREYLVNYLANRMGDPRSRAYFKEAYGISFDDLVPVAHPTDVSAALLLHIGARERFGWCYLWHHDDVGELTCPQPSFDAAIAAFTAGLERRDEKVLGFLGIVLG